MFGLGLNLCVGNANRSVFVDADASAFFTAAGITDATQKTAVNQLVVDLKAASIWTKMYLIYPFVGGTAAAHKWNLKDPRDLDAAYRGGFNGSYTHNANGITPSGNCWVDTYLNGLSTLSKTNTHFSFYSRTNVSEGSSEFGANNVGNTLIYPNLGGIMYVDIPSEAERFTATISDTRGHFTGTLGASARTVYRNGSSIASAGAAAGDFANTTMVFNNGRVGFSAPSSRNLAFASLGTSLTAGEVSAFYTAVQAFQTTLARQV